MTTRAMLYKEFRAQAAAFFIALAALAAAPIWPGRIQDALILFIDLNAATILGAIAFGHEYSHHTMTTALMQPVARARTYAIKMSVLTAMLLVIAAATAFVGRSFLGTMAIGRTAALGVPLLAGLGTAPLMSMMGRGVITGVLLTYAVNGAVMTIVVLLEAISIAAGSDGMRDRLGEVMPAALAAAHGAMLLLSGRHFMRLEAGDAQIALKGYTRFGTASAARHRRVWSALISKELHVQQVPVFMTAALGVIWVVIALLTRVVPAWSSFPVGAMALVYVNSFAAIVGISAITFEMRAGTHAMQLLQPVAAWQQYLVKTLVAFVVALVCGFVLPALMATLVHTTVTGEMAWRMVMLAMFLVTMGLYLSSIAAQPVVGLALAMPLALVFGRLLQWVVDVFRSPLGAARGPFLPGWALFFTSPIPVTIVGAFMLWLAFVNYSSDEPKVLRSFVQVAAIAAVASAAMIFVI